MKAIVVYESLWGNTAAIARAIGEGIGPAAQVLSTAEATGEAIAGADLIVAGAPVLGFRLPTDAMRRQIASTPGRGTPPPDVSHPSMRDWLEGLPAAPAGGKPALAAAFETRIWWSPGGSTGAIGDAFRRGGYRLAGTAHKFVVKGKYGPLRDGEIERARSWGEELARATG